MKTALQAAGREIAGDIKCFALEIFPKQDALKGKGYGNLVKLPLGVHRRTGGKSGFIPVPMDKPDQQFAFLRTISPAPAENFRKLAAGQGKAEVIVHPRQSEWAEKYPELAVLSSRCALSVRSLRWSGPTGSFPCARRRSCSGSSPITLGVVCCCIICFRDCRNTTGPFSTTRSAASEEPFLVASVFTAFSRGRSTIFPASFEQVSGYPHPLLHLPDFVSSLCRFLSGWSTCRTPCST